jgi:cell division protein FtsB
VARDRAENGEAGDMPERNQRHLRALFWLGPLAALLGAAMALLYDADNGLRAIFSLNDELDVVDVRLEKLERERGDLVARAERLRSDALEIESEARESLGMVRPHEIVVRLRNAPPRGD